VAYVAGQQIRLEPGFRAATGSSFHAFHRGSGSARREPERQSWERRRAHNLHLCGE
jgi:hypothetical protein